MLESMRNDAMDAVRLIETSLPLVESFYNVRFPTASVRIWYGFKVGNTGGGGQLYTEDRSTYLMRTGGAFKPYDPVMVHELSHSYMSNECLNPDAMRNAYRAVYPLRPPYGSALSPPVIQAFLSAVPPQHQAAVSAKLAAVTF